MQKRILSLTAAIVAAPLFLCARAQAQDKCPSKEKPLKQDVFNLLGDIESGKKTPKSVDEFVGMLPDKMKKDFIFMTNSRSFQNSDSKDPRVLMKSPNSEMIASFNSHPDQRGFERVEMMAFNEKEAKFEFYDVEFPGERKDKEADPATNGKGAIVTKNPERCLKCHHEPARPNWDPYNFWAGQTPFNRDTVYAGSAEGKVYTDLLKRIENGEPRYRQLKPTVKSTDFTSGSKQLSTVNEGDGANPDGPGVRMFDQLSTLNFCRIGQQLKEHPMVDAFKIAAFGALRGCSLKDMVPLEMQEKMRKYFAERGIESSSFDDLVAKVRKDTEGKQARVFEDKKARQTAYFEELTGSKTEAQKEMNKRQLENRESSIGTVAPLRVLLEPFDVDMRNWSMSQDPDTYTFADVIDQLRNQGMFADVAKLEAGKGCDEISKDSLREMKRAEGLKGKGCPTCADVQAVQPAAKELCNKTELGALEKKAASVFENNCVVCHRDDAMVFGAPKIPLEESEKFRKLLTSDMSVVGWAERIWSRVTREPGVPGHMPLVEGLSLDKEELTTLRAYFDKLSPGGCNSTVPAAKPGGPSSTVN